MQPEAKEPEEDSVWEEPPSVLWGLDPMFNAFNRLYVKDILQMRESCLVSGIVTFRFDNMNATVMFIQLYQLTRFISPNLGIYFYNSHPIFKVDVLGTVVYKREREDFFCYGGNDEAQLIHFKYSYFVSSYQTIIHMQILSPCKSNMVAVIIALQLMMVLVL